MAPNLWAGSLLLTLALAGPAAASAQRPVDVGSVRARAESVKAKGDSGKTAPSPERPRPTAPAAKPGSKLAAAAATRPASKAVAGGSTAPAATPAKPAAKPEDAAATDLKDPAQSEVLRESFSYGGAARDPFASLIKSNRGGPELTDLQLVAIYEDLRSSANSIAVLREKNGGKRHKLRVGDQIGRLKVAQVRSKDVVFTISDFGYERQETLSLRKQEDVTP